MKLPMFKTRNPLTLACSVVLAAALLSGCQTDGDGPGPFASLTAPAKPAEPEKPPEPPMTKSRAAMQCLMETEKGHASADLDKRADVVNKCIDQKLKTAGGAKG
jgi:hypothetical protein